MMKLDRLQLFVSFNFLIMRYANLAPSEFDSEGYTYFVVKRNASSANQALSYCKFELHESHLVTIKSYYQLMSLSGYLYSRVLTMSQPKCDVFHLYDVQLNTSSAPSRRLLTLNGQHYLRFNSSVKIKLFCTLCQWNRTDRWKKHNDDLDQLCGKNGFYNPSNGQCYLLKRGRQRNGSCDTGDIDSTAKKHLPKGTRPHLATPDTTQEHTFIVGLMLSTIDSPTPNDYYFTDAGFYWFQGRQLGIWNAIRMSLPEWLTNQFNGQVKYCDHLSIRMYISRVHEPAVIACPPRSFDRHAIYGHTVCQWFVNSNNRNIYGISFFKYESNYFTLRNTSINPAINCESYVDDNYHSHGYHFKEAILSTYNELSYLAETIRSSSVVIVECLLVARNSNDLTCSQLYNRFKCRWIDDLWIIETTRLILSKTWAEVCFARYQPDILFTPGNRVLCLGTPGINQTTSANRTVSSTTCKSTMTAPTVSILTCEQREKDGLLWPGVKAGSKSIIECSKHSGHGEATWQCNKYGIFDSEGPNYAQCINETLRKVVSKIHPGSIVQSSMELKNISKNISDYNTMEMKYLIGSFKKTFEACDQFVEMNQEINEIKSKTISKVISNTLETITNVLNNPARKAWNRISKNGQQSLVSSILQNSEKIGLLYSDFNSASFSSENCEMSIISESQHLEYINYEDGMAASNIVVKELKLKQNISSVGTTFKNIQRYMGFINADESIKVTDKTVVNSKLIGLNIGDKIHGNISVEIKLMHTNHLNHNTVQCVFWNMSSYNGTKGFWDSTGCRVNISSESYTICKCNHLTNFAILMDSQGTISDHKSTYLTTLSISLLSLSILCLVFTIISHVIAKPLKNRKGMITLNLSCCMLVAQILLPVGSAKPDNKIACGVLAGLTEYFWLATFMWMLWEGYYVYKMLIKVFNPQSLPFQWFFVTSYAIPAIPIFISAAIKPDGYLNIKGDTCWITSEDGFRWSFMAPVCLVILINTIIYSLTLKSAKNAMISNTSKASFTRLFKGSASLFAILGLTWIFGILIPVSNVFSAIFIVFNASQGVFIFFFHVVINQSARRDIMQRLTTFKFLGTSQSSGSGSSSGLRNKGTSSDDSKRTSVFKLSSYSSSTK